MKAGKVLMGALLLFAMAGASPAAAQEDLPAQEEPVRVEDGVVTVTDVSLSVDGEPVERLSPGRKTQVRLTMRNDGERGIGDGTLVLEPFHEEMTIDPREIKVGSIAPGESARATFTVEVTKQACYEPLGLGASIRDGDTHSYLKAEIPSFCPGSKIAFWSVRYDGGDGDGVPEPGEELDVYVMLRNDGRDPGTDLRGVIKSMGEDVRVLREEVRWETITKGEEKESVAAFRIAIADDAEQAAGCGPIMVDEPIVRDGDTAVSSDGGVAEGPPDANSGGGGADGSTGSGEQTEPGSTGSAGEGTKVEEGTVAPEPGTVPDGTEPGPADGTEPEPEPQPEPMDQPAMFELRLTVTGADTDMQTDIGSGPMCVMEDGMARDDVATSGQDLQRGGPASLAGERTSARSSGPTAVAAGLLIAVAAGLVLTRRYLMPTQ